ncbi:hypothetical protein AB3329_10010 [Streptococcus sp. H31]|uniref:hypothetical protein n=1 Tax=Streptococcus huangxiaojuni TaxID=3237239 RepID=UPI0034A168D2
MFYLLFALSAIILALAAYFAARSGLKKGLLLPLFSLLFLLIAFGLYKGFDRTHRSGSENTKETTPSTLKYSEDKTFSWDREAFDSLTVGDPNSGNGGMTYDDIVAAYGEPSTAFESTTDNITTRFISYQTAIDNENVSVSLRFINQSDGSWLLSYKFAENLK